MITTRACSCNFSAFLILLLTMTCNHVPAAAQTASARLPAPTVPEGFGVNIHFTDPQPGEMERFAEAGYRLARMDLFWGSVEREKGVYDFSAYDRLVEHLAKAGARPLFILDYGNDLYQKGAPTTPEAQAAFARFAAAAAARYKGKGVLWEIWNEPNLGQFWQPKPDAAAYARLALATAKAVRAVDPDAVIVAPGSSGFPWEFFETVFAAGLLEHIDAVSVHPYRGQNPETAAADYARLRVLIARYAPAAKRNTLPIISSEWGYSTVVGGVSEERQAQYLARQWLSNLASGVNLSIFYDWRDDGDDPKENEHRFGTVRRDFTPKPSFLAAKRLIAELNGYTFRHRIIDEKDDRAWKLLFQKGDTDQLALVTWMTDEKAPETSRMPAIRKVAASDADFVNLRRLASIRFLYGPRAYSSDGAARLEAAVRNPETEKASVALAVGIQSSRVRRDVPAGGTLTLPPVAIPGGGRSTRMEQPPVMLQFFWNDAPLPAVGPIVARLTDPLIIAAAPRGDDLLVTLENPSRKAFTGQLVLDRGRQAANESVPLRYEAGTERVTATLPSPGEAAHRLRILEKNAIVAQTEMRAYRPLKPFPETVGPQQEFGFVQSVENVAQPPTPLSVVKTPPGSPAPTALSFRWDFPGGWRYAQATPQAGAIPPMPEKARALVAWIHSDGSGDFLRSRFRDSTGQTFQVDLPKLEWKGWRLITIPLDGSGSGVHWGGANDGVPHKPLAWDGLILVDSANRELPHGGEVLIAAPTYVLGE